MASREDITCCTAPGCPFQECINHKAWFAGPQGLGDVSNADLSDECAEYQKMLAAIEQGDGE